MYFVFAGKSKLLILVPGYVIGDPKSQYVYPFSGKRHGKRSWGTPHISTTLSVQIENSADLESGRRPDYKSAEFSNCIKRIIEKVFDFGRYRDEIVTSKGSTYWDFESSLRVPRGRAD